jgi:hypothetical protein
LRAKHEALGLNTNTAFNTGYGGVAYRCAK